jgi:hypothetical protein
MPSPSVVSASAPAVPSAGVVVPDLLVPVRAVLLRDVDRRVVLLPPVRRVVLPDLRLVVARAPVPELRPRLEERPLELRRFVLPPLLRFVVLRRFVPLLLRFVLLRFVPLAVLRRLVLLRLVLLRFVVLRPAELRLVELRLAELRFAELRFVDARFVVLRFVDARFVVLRRFAVLRLVLLRLADARFVVLRRLVVPLARFVVLRRLVAPLLRLVVLRLLVLRRFAVPVERFVVLRRLVVPPLRDEVVRRVPVERELVLRFVLDLLRAVAICSLLVGDVGGNADDLCSMRAASADIQQERHLSYFEMSSTRSPVCASDALRAMSAWATMPTSLPSSSTTGKRRT